MEEVLNVPWWAMRLSLSMMEVVPGGMETEGGDVATLVAATIVGDGRWQQLSFATSGMGAKGVMGVVVSVIGWNGVLCPST